MLFALLTPQVQHFLTFCINFAQKSLQIQTESDRYCICKITPTYSLFSHSSHVSRPLYSSREDSVNIASRNIKALLLNSKAVLASYKATFRSLELQCATPPSTTTTTTTQKKPRQLQRNSYFLLVQMWFKLWYIRKMIQQKK